MVERRVTDGERIGQLLASELTGLAVGPLDAVAVVDADPDATPAESGHRAYRVAHEGAVVADVALYPDCVEIRLHGGLTWPDDAGGRGVAVESAGRLRVDSGASVKRAVDALRAVLTDER